MYIADRTGKKSSSRQFFKLIWLFCLISVAAFFFAMQKSKILFSSVQLIRFSGSIFVSNLSKKKPSVQSSFFVNSFPLITRTAFKTSTSINSTRLSSSLSNQEKEEKKEHQYTAPDPDKLASLMPDFDSAGRAYTLYEKCVRRLYLTNLFHPVKLGLDNMEKLHEAIGNPMNSKDLVLVHVAGTNGKGSTSLKIARTLEQAGLKVGLFVSPHVASFRERMQVNGDYITEEEVEFFLPKIYEICEKQKIPATFFEVTTALAFHFFAERKCNAVVLETGLGGRLDATNVVKSPDLSVITSIGLEHTRILGDTVELIASEKAGIIKSGCPVLVGPHCPHETIRECASEKHASAYYTLGDILGESANFKSPDIDEDFVDYDIENANIARAAIQILRNGRLCGNIELSDKAIERGVSQRPPCRFEEMQVDGPNGKKVRIILDVAHNPDAMEYLVQKLEATYPSLKQKTRIVAGFSADKDIKLCGNSLLNHLSDPSMLHLVEAAHPRAAKLEEMLLAEPLLKKSNFDEKDRSITNQVKSALALAEERGELLIVCGSVFLMAEAREALGIEEPRDSKYIAEVAGANLRHGQEFFADQDPEKEENKS